MFSKENFILIFSFLSAISSFSGWGVFYLQKKSLERSIAGKVQYFISGSVTIDGKLYPFFLFRISIVNLSQHPIRIVDVRTKIRIGLRSYELDKWYNFKQVALTLSIPNISDTKKLVEKIIDFPKSILQPDSDDLSGYVMFLSKKDIPEKKVDTITMIFEDSSGRNYTIETDHKKLLSQYITTELDDFVVEKNLVSEK